MDIPTQKRRLPHALCLQAALVEQVYGSGLSALRMAERIASRFTQFAEQASSGMSNQHALTTLALTLIVLLA